MLKSLFSRLRGRRGLIGVAAAVLGIAVCGAIVLHDGAGAGVESTSGGVVRRVKVCRVGSDAEGSVTAYPGIVKPSRSAALAFRVGGPLIDVLVRRGDRVFGGDVLMRIDPRDYRRAVKSAESLLSAASARLEAMQRGARIEDIRALEANIAAAEARASKARLDRDRARHLFAQNVVSKAELDQAESADAVAAATLDSLKQELEKAKAGSRAEDIRAAEAEIRGLEAALESARDRLADTVLRAPFDGIITRQHVENHEMVNAGVPVIALHDLSEVEIEVNVPEGQLVSDTRRAGLRVRVTFPTLRGREFTAVLREITTDADPVTRTFALTFTMPQPADVNILSGMTAEAHLRRDAAGRAPLLTVPVSAVLSDPGLGSYVWILEVGSEYPVRRSVEVSGTAGENRLRVPRGLSAGERVITAGAHFITADTRVRESP